MNFRKSIVAIVAAGVLAAAGGSLAQAQTTPAPDAGGAMAPMSDGSSMAEKPMMKKKMMKKKMSKKHMKKSKMM